MSHRPDQTCQGWISFMPNKWLVQSSTLDELFNFVLQRRMVKGLTQEIDCWGWVVGLLGTKAQDRAGWGRGLLGGLKGWGLGHGQFCLYEYMATEALKLMPWIYFVSQEVKEYLMCLKIFYFALARLVLAFCHLYFNHWLLRMPKGAKYTVRI